MNVVWDQQATGAMAAAAAFFITLAAVPLVIRFCVRARILDLPGALKLHSRPVPRLGGIALALGIAGGAAFAGRAAGHGAIPFFAALAIICAVGIFDDVRSAGLWPRLVTQFAAATLLWSAGWRLPLAGAGAVNLIVTCVFVAAFVNAFNFLDGSDGLAAGVAGVVALSFAILPASFASTLGSALAWSVAGAAAAFLFFNFPPARIFMGDSGSTSLGFVIAFLALDFYRATGAASNSAPGNLRVGHPAFASVLLFPLFVALLPLFDAALAIARRLRHRGSPFAGDRRHFYDLFLRRGWTQARIVTWTCAESAVFAVAARMALRMGPIGSVALFAAGASVLMAGGILLGSLREEDGGVFRTIAGAQSGDVNSSEPRFRIAK
ncbi:MAG: glycosyltransferase family 4 protein [Candidatus Acidiferrales bacterium]